MKIFVLSFYIKKFTPWINRYIIFENLKDLQGEEKNLSIVYISNDKSQSIRKILDPPNSSSPPLTMLVRETIETKGFAGMTRFDESSSGIIRFFSFFPPVLSGPIVGQGIEILAEVNWFRWIRF